MQRGCGCFGAGGILVLVFWILHYAASRGAAFATDSVLVQTLFLSLGLLVLGAIFGMGAASTSLFSGAYRRVQKTGLYAVGFALVCFISAFGVTLRPGGFSMEAQTAAEGGTVGPISVDKPDATLTVEVEQNVQGDPRSSYQRWSFVTVELLDEKKNYLSSFGGEFWKYAGYNGERWMEEDKEYRAVLRVSTPGTYYLQLKTESNVQPKKLSPIKVRVESIYLWGVPLPLQIAGYVSLFLGTVMLVMTAARETPDE